MIKAIDNEKLNIFFTASGRMLGVPESKIIGMRSMFRMMFPEQLAENNMTFKVSPANIPIEEVIKKNVFCNWGPCEHKFKNGKCKICGFLEKEASY